MNQKKSLKKKRRKKEMFRCIANAQKGGVNNAAHLEKGMVSNQLVSERMKGTRRGGGAQEREGV